MFEQFLVQGVQIILAEKIILTHVELQLLLLFIVPSKLTLEVELLYPSKGVTAPCSLLLHI